MFDYKKLTVYNKALHFNKDILPLLSSTIKDHSTRDQLNRAALSIVLNIAESSSRFSKADRRRFLVISRGSAFECAAILDYLDILNKEEKSTYSSLISDLEQISKMLYAMIRKLE